MYESENCPAKEGMAMSDEVNATNSQQFLDRLVRNNPSETEVSVVTSPGARAAAWPIKIKSLSSYNVYNVIAVEIGETGSLPIEIGQQMQAVFV